jgi:redox-sensitive bicupin YhaK (pirin superfamily)
VLLASRDGRQGSLQVQQDADLWMTVLPAGEGRELPLRAGRHAWVHLARGTASLNGQALSEGDGAAVTGEERLQLQGQDEAEVLVFDLG